jgi:hypothetical protein
MTSFIVGGRDTMGSGSARQERFAVHVNGLSFVISFRGELVEYRRRDGEEWRSANARYLEGFLRPVATFTEFMESGGKGTCTVLVLRNDNGRWFVRRDFWDGGPFYLSGDEPDIRETYMIDPSSLRLKVEVSG